MCAFDSEVFYFLPFSNNINFKAIKKYIVGLIIKNSSEPELLEKEKVYVNKLNVILTQVIIII
jgi:hypothetical protein